MSALQTEGVREWERGGRECTVHQGRAWVLCCSWGANDLGRSFGPYSHQQKQPLSGWTAHCKSSPIIPCSLYSTCTILAPALGTRVGRSWRVPCNTHSRKSTATQEGQCCHSAPPSRARHLPHKLKENLHCLSAIQGL